MAIRFKAGAPAKLLAAFKKAIDDGHVRTWSYDSAGDFTHTPDQWKNKAWLRPKIEPSDTLSMYIVSSKNAPLTWPIYGVFQGRFVESMIEHCHDLFSVADATSKPVAGDIV